MASFTHVRDGDKVQLRNDFNNIPAGSILTIWLVHLDDCYVKVMEYDDNIPFSSLKILDPREERKRSLSELEAQYPTSNSHPHKTLQQYNEEREDEKRRWDAW